MILRFHFFAIVFSQKLPGRPALKNKKCLDVEKIELNEQLCNEIDQSLNGNGKIDQSFKSLIKIVLGLFGGGGSSYPSAAMSQCPSGKSLER